VIYTLGDRTPEFEGAGHFTENKVFPDGSLILGAPAKVARELSEEEIAHIRWSAEVYVENAARFNRSLIRAV